MYFVFGCLNIFKIYMVSCVDCFRFTVTFVNVIGNTWNITLLRVWLGKLMIVFFVFTEKN